MTRRDALKAALFGAVVVVLGRVVPSGNRIPQATWVNPYRKTLTPIRITAAHGVTPVVVGLATVGEHGPETLVMLPPGGWVIPPAASARWFPR